MMNSLWDIFICRIGGDRRQAEKLLRDIICACVGLTEVKNYETNMKKDLR